MRPTVTTATAERSVTCTERTALEGVRALKMLADATKCSWCKTPKGDARQWRCRIDRSARTVSILCPSCQRSHSRRAVTNTDRRRLRLREAELSLARLTR